MAFDEAVLEMLGLAPLWVRRDTREVVGAGGGVVSTVAAKADGGDASPPAEGRAALSGPAGQAPAAAAPERASRPQSIPDGGEAFARRTREAAPMAPEPAPPAERKPARASDPPLRIEPAADIAPPPESDSPREIEAQPARQEAAVRMLDWDALAARVASCEGCRLCERRTNTVFGVGDREADWMLIGEAPGENEDKQGEPFVGQAGKLLDSMLRALALARGDNVYIANVVKCRPPGNRNPEPDEVARCEPYLQRQVALVKPKLIVALGRVAAQNLLKTDASISSLRGRVHRYEDVPVIVTYHPAYLLRSLHDKAKAWADLCLAHDTYRQALGGRAGE
ncbi:uracil-DNA glycosylase [Trinickia caryophylli]|uniref:Type-4 uracil-DNA glycosylase n=1 Tax=Trinickia caryophylli TaxID=28094 RepID=A0A1X7DIU7_TRICW|nr:uracil-DNA glycosylase [Trinickia caryophylli]PMS12266.1 uracil-DNA glycosylase [Trinickia caryophylli]TRX17064.1 uracil-DNA glycosylase [Trinickia caryophylli]WQE12203.1 uracil-DNA glycosylase [Trinickia caryophylli]SMF16427.1 DNA polymerase [Trinickia caryophylli]GLU31662.1 hypothetical protein Busp01_15040 [Trinickia caryophylli]